MYIIVGLGNPGRQYENTRHNIGFDVIETLAKQNHIAVLEKKHKAIIGKGFVEGRKCILAKPQTFMNLSGDAVIQAVKYYQVPPERVVVVSDDVSLPLTKLRVRCGGSAGGHNGLKSIIARLETDAFPRVKVGVGAPPHPDYDMADWVLGSFKNQDAVDIAAAAQRAWEAVKCYITEGPERTMNQYN